MTGSGGGYLARPAPSGLADVLEIVLDKGIVVDAYARVALMGIELVTVDARVVVSSVDTYLRFAEATNRLDLIDRGPPSLADVIEEGVGRTIENVASHVVENKVEEGIEKVEEVAEHLGPVAETVVEGAEKLVAKVVEKVVPDPED
ncbi:gas vesicle protein [Nocardioides sp. CER19]|nr:gas vesicle protein GvpJ [Nocardioides sp. CER19]MDH2413423.1 gas vesicle protein [Nocardioides sp. CER19]